MCATRGEEFEKLMTHKENISQCIPGGRIDRCCSNLHTIWPGRIMYTKILKLESQLIIVIICFLVFFYYLHWFNLKQKWFFPPLMNTWTLVTSCFIPQDTYDWCCPDTTRWVKMEFLIAESLISQVILSQRTQPLWNVNERAHTEVWGLPEPRCSTWYRAELSSLAAWVSLLSPHLSVHSQEVCVYQAFLSMDIGGHYQGWTLFPVQP